MTETLQRSKRKIQTIPAEQIAAREGQLIARLKILETRYVVLNACSFESAHEQNTILDYLEYLLGLIEAEQETLQSFSNDLKNITAEQLVNWKTMRGLSDRRFEEYRIATQMTLNDKLELVSQTPVSSSLDAVVHTLAIVGKGGRRGNIGKRRPQQGQANRGRTLHRSKL